MAIGRDTSFTWLGPRGGRGPDARRQGHPVRSLAGQPEEPALARTASRSCDLLLVTHGHGDHMGDAVAIATRLPARLAVHPRDEPVARAAPARRHGPAHRHEQGRHGRGRGTQGVDGPRRPLGRRLEPGRRDDALPRRAGRASSSSWRTASASTTRATRRSSATWRSSASCSGRTSRCCRSAATTRWTRSARRSPSSSSACSHVLPIHWGTFPILAGTPQQLAGRDRRPRRHGHGPRLEPRRHDRLSAADLRQSRAGAPEAPQPADGVGSGAVRGGPDAYARGGRPGPSRRRRPIGQGLRSSRRDLRYLRGQRRQDLPERNGKPGATRGRKATGLGRHQTTQSAGLPKPGGQSRRDCPHHGGPPHARCPRSDGRA